MTDKQLPHDLEAERSILGGIMIDQKIFHVVNAIIGPTDFLVGAHRKIYEAISRLIDQRAAIDPLTVKSELAKAGDLESIGGLRYLATITDGLPTALNWQAYAELVREKSRLRQIMAECAKTTALCVAGEDDASAIIEAHQATLRRFKTGNTAALSSAADVMAATYGLIERRHADKRKVTGIATGIYALDELTTGFQPGDMVVISAKTGFGKTALALNCMTHAMTCYDKRVILFSLEMAHDQLCTRIISAMTGIDGYAIRTGYIRDADWHRIAEVSAQLSECKFWIHDKSITIGELDSRCRQAADEHGVDMIVVDYLQLVTVGGTRKAENRTQEVTEVSRGLKALATDLQIPVVAVSQLNAEGEARESRAIEHDAGVFIRIEMDPGELKTYDQVPAKIHVQKNRNGSLGTIEARFVKKITKFMEA